MTDERATDNQAEATEQPKLPKRLLLRIPRTSLLVPLGVMTFAIPFASGWPPLWLVYLAPLAAGYAVIRYRTTVDAEGIHARGLFGSKQIPWSALRSLRISERSWARAVLADETEVTLPTVRARHVPALSLMSGGLIADPTAQPAAEEQAADDSAAQSTEATEQHTPGTREQQASTAEAAAPKD